MTVSHGKPYAGNPHVRFDEGADVPDEGRSALLHQLNLVNMPNQRHRDLDRYDDNLAASIFTHLVKLLFVKRKIISEHAKWKIRFSLCLRASVLKTTPSNCRLPQVLSFIGKVVLFAGLGDGFYLQRESQFQTSITNFHHEPSLISEGRFCFTLQNVSPVYPCPTTLRCKPVSQGLHHTAIDQRVHSELGCSHTSAAWMRGWWRSRCIRRSGRRM